MEQLLKMTNVNKYLTAIRAANALRTGIYAAVIALGLFRVFKVYKALAK